MLRWVVVVLALTSCKDKRAENAQAPAADRAPGALPPEPEATDVTRGIFAELIDHDLPKAKSLYTKACEDGVPGGCAYAIRVDASKDAKATATKLEKLCNGGDAWGCYLFADVHDDLRELTFEERSVLYLKACDLAVPDACHDLGMKYEAGAHRDPDKARELFMRACTLGDRTSCGLARMVQ